jgi:hypothetical protein
MDYYQIRVFIFLGEGSGRKAGNSEATNLDAPEYKIS